MITVQPFQIMATEEFSTATKLQRRIFIWISSQVTQVSRPIKKLSKLINNIWIFKSFSVFLISHARAVWRGNATELLKKLGGEKLQATPRRKTESYYLLKVVYKIFNKHPRLFYLGVSCPVQYTFSFSFWHERQHSQEHFERISLEARLVWPLSHQHTCERKSYHARQNFLTESGEKWTFLPRTSFSNFFIEIKINYTARFIMPNLEKRWRFISIIAKS